MFAACAPDDVVRLQARNQKVTAADRRRVLAAAVLAAVRARAGPLWVQSVRNCSGTDLICMAQSKRVVHVASAAVMPWHTHGHCARLTTDEAGPAHVLLTTAAHTVSHARICELAVSEGLLSTDCTTDEPGKQSRHRTAGRGSVEVAVAIRGLGDRARDVWLAGIIPGETPG